MNYRKEWHESLGSTNDRCKQAALAGAEEGLVILAKAQTNGRGRMGRSFFSPKGTGLYMTLLLRPAFDAEQCTRLTALAAVAVCRAIKKLTPFSPRIKWVNDVYLGDKKLCGILTQACARCDARPEFMLVGIGVNLLAPSDGFPPEIAHLATGLYPSHPHPDALREQLADAILSEFDQLYSPDAWESAVEEYRSLCFLVGRKVEVLRGSERYEATVLGVNKDLSLQIRKNDQSSLVLQSGEVSLKLT